MLTPDLYFLAHPTTGPAYQSEQVHMSTNVNESVMMSTAVCCHHDRFGSGSVKVHFRPPHASQQYPDFC